jgi:hypothetical protein
MDLTGLNVQKSELTNEEYHFVYTYCFGSSVDRL